jgi:hypothetical protein
LRVKQPGAQQAGEQKDEQRGGRSLVNIEAAEDDEGGDQQHPARAY